MGFPDPFMGSDAFSESMYDESFFRNAEGLPSGAEEAMQSNTSTLNTSSNMDVPNPLSDGHVFGKSMYGESIFSNAAVLPSSAAKPVESDMYAYPYGGGSYPKSIEDEFDFFNAAGLQSIAAQATQPDMNGYPYGKTFRESIDNGSANFTVADPQSSAADVMPLGMYGSAYDAKGSFAQGTGMYHDGLLEPSIGDANLAELGHQAHSSESTSSLSNHHDEAFSVKDMRNDIKAIIAPHRATGVKPPFTEAQLIIMALLLHDKPQTIADLLKWLFNNFSYYQDIARSYFADCPDANKPSPTIVKRTIWQTVWRFEMPVRHTPNALHAPLLFIPSEDYQRVMNNFFTPAPPNDGRGGCHFFDLPGEIRNQIYELVFAYPQAGVRPRSILVEVESQSTNIIGKPCMVLETYTRSYTEAFDKGMWPDRDPQWDVGYRRKPPYSAFGGNTLRTNPIVDILDCLRTCRKFYDEAYHVFFKINHFYFKSPKTLHEFLAAIYIKQPKYIQCFEHISLSFDIKNHPGDHIKLLAAMPRLAKLEFHVDEKEWKEVASTIPGRYNGRPIDNFTGFLYLSRRVRAREVLFHGCPTLEEKLKAQMTKETEGSKEEVKAGKKRGAGGPKGVRTKKTKTG